MTLDDFLVRYTSVVLLEYHLWPAGARCVGRCCIPVGPVFSAQSARFCFLSACLLGPLVRFVSRVCLSDRFVRPVSLSVGSVCPAYAFNLGAR